MTMIKTLSLAAVIGALSLPALAQNFQSDQGHTEVEFSWSHAGVSTQHGEFTSVSAVLDLNVDAIEQSQLNVTIATDSLASGFGPLDDHLKSSDFLDVATYPEITFVSTGITQTGDTTAEVTGDLTIHGVTQSVVLDTVLTHQGPHPLGSVIDYYQGEWVAFSASAEIDHMAFGVGPFSTGPITIRIDTEMKAAQ